MENDVLLVEGMKCDKCSAAVEKAVSDLAGVTAVEVDRGAGTVDVTYDADLVNREAIQNVIEAAGFVVVA